MERQVAVLAYVQVCINCGIVHY